MIKKTIFFFSIAIFFIAASSCKKTPGEGGNAQIKGIYWVRNYDPYFQFVTGRYPAVNTSVYLFFGDDVSPGTSVKTNNKGEFEFTYLRKGKYNIDEKWLDEIDTQDKAYFLGLMFSDGNVNSKSNGITLALMHSDKEILEKLSIILYGFIKLEKYKDATNLCLYSKVLKERLIENGIFSGWQ